MQFVRETPHVYVQVLQFPNSSIRKRFSPDKLCLNKFVRRTPGSHGRFLISSPTATPTLLRLPMSQDRVTLSSSFSSLIVVTNFNSYASSPVATQAVPPAFHFVPSKTFSRNKTHQKHYSVPLNRFIWDKILRFGLPKKY